MPTYPYRCANLHEWDVVKSVRSIDDPEVCSTCGSTDTQRYLARVNFNGASDWNRAEYNPGLGCITKGTADAERKAKARGLIPVGNENVDRVMASQEAKLESDRNERFESAFAPAQYQINKLMNRI